MGTTIATKADLQILRSELHQECAPIRKDMEIMATTLSNNISMISSKFTLRKGSMLVVAIGLLFAALKLT